MASDAENAAREYFELILWPEGPRCPHCGNRDQGRVYQIAENHAKKARPGMYMCAECRRQYTVTIGTVMERSHIPLHKWLLAWYAMSNSKARVYALGLQRQLGIGSYRTAWRMCRRIRSAPNDFIGDTTLLAATAGKVEAEPEELQEAADGYRSAAVSDFLDKVQYRIPSDEYPGLLELLTSIREASEEQDDAPMATKSVAVKQNAGDWDADAWAEQIAADELDADTARR